MIHTAVQTVIHKDQPLEYRRQIQDLSRAGYKIRKRYSPGGIPIIDDLQKNLVKKQNKFVVFKGMKVEPIGEDGDAFLYNWDGSGEEGSDLYFNVSVNGATYNFTVESDLCGPDTDVYKAVKDLKVGDVIDLQGFLYWYEGPNPHITAVLAQ